MLQISLINQPNARTLDTVIEKPEIVFAIQDLVAVLAKEVLPIFWQIRLYRC
jgi:hypothetical protein